MHAAVELGSQPAATRARVRLTAPLPLLTAIVSEVGATLSLRMATHGSKRWCLPAGADYLVAFTSLAPTLQADTWLGVAYGIWAVLGVALASRFLF